MIDSLVRSLLIGEIVAEKGHKDILKVLAVRFGPLPLEPESELRSILDETVLDAAVELAGACPDLDLFAAELRAIPRIAGIEPTSPIAELEKRDDDGRVLDYLGATRAG